MSHHSQFGAIASLDALQALEGDLLLPGHGPHIADRARTQPGCTQFYPLP
jgi:hypothetical protein